MKKYITLITCFLCIFCITSAQDRLIKHSGDTTICCVVEINENIVKYKYPGEEVLNTAYMNAISSIILSSGRVIQGNPTIEIIDETDWAKVILASSADEVKGLELVTEISEKVVSAALGSYANLHDLKEKAIENIKKQAARNQCHVVYITADNSKNGITGTRSWPTANLTANAYRYPGQKFKFINKEQLFEDAVTAQDTAFLCTHLDYAISYYNSTVQLVKLKDSRLIENVKKRNTILYKFMEITQSISNAPEFDMEYIMRLLAKTEKQHNDTRGKPKRK